MSFNNSFINGVPNQDMLLQPNKLCDYIELRCLINQDKFLSKDDVELWFCEQSQSDGTEIHAELSDSMHSKIDSCFEQISFRAKETQEYYPFTYVDGCLTVREIYSLEQLQYIILLLSSNHGHFDKTSSNTLTTYFEEYCLPYFSCLVPVNADNYVFGTSREQGPFKGNLRNRIEQLAELISAQTTKTFDNDPKYDVPAGDGGLDLISILKIDDATHLPVALAQCTCSYKNWEKKQSEISHDIWRLRIDPLIPFSEFMFVPFFLRNAGGKFENPTSIRTYLIDRMRFMRLIRTNNESLISVIDYNKQLDLIEACCDRDFRMEIQSALHMK